MRALLLDMDGVVLKNHPAHRLVSHRCSQYVARVTGTKDFEKASALNKHLYESTGHTVLGLRSIGYNVCIDEFNKFVYKSRICFKNTDNTEVLALEKACKNNNITPYIYSNAPDSWVEDVLVSMGVEMESLGNITNKHLKPEPISYEKVENHVKTDGYILIDDKMINIIPIVGKKGWTGCLYAPGMPEGKITSTLKTIARLERVFI